MEDLKGVGDCNILNLLDCRIPPPNTNCSDGDIAESYGTDEPVQRGDIVVLADDTTSREYGVSNPAPGESKDATYTITTANVRKATAASRGKIVGAVPTSPEILGHDVIDPKAHPQLVALVGHVPVRMTLEGGPIAIGDPITVAENTPGAGMKATTSGRILGYALAPFTADSHPDSGMVEVLVHLEDWTAPQERLSIASLKAALADAMRRLSELERKASRSNHAVSEQR